MIRLASNVRPGSGGRAPDRSQGRPRPRGAATEGSAGASYRELVRARLRGREVELAAVDRPATDDALDPDFLDRAELLDVGKRRQAPGGEYRNRQHLRQLDRGIDV